MKKEELKDLAFVANFEATKSWQMTEPWLSMTEEEKAKFAQFIKDSKLVVNAIQATLAVVYDSPYSDFEIDVQEMRDGGQTEEQMKKNIETMDRLKFPILEKLKGL